LFPRRVAQPSDLTPTALPQPGPSHLLSGLRQQPALFLRQHFRMKFGDLLISLEQRISPCSKGLNSKFTLLKNSRFQRVYAIELTALQFSDLRVTHGQGAENAVETQR
jgi:hypothetical protein